MCFFSWSATVVCHAIKQAENEFLRLGVKCLEYSIKYSIIVFLAHEMDSNMVPSLNVQFRFLLFRAVVRF